MHVAIDIIYTVIVITGVTWTSYRDTAIYRYNFIHHWSPLKQIQATIHKQKSTYLNILFKSNHRTNYQKTNCNLHT